MLKERRTLTKLRAELKERKGKLCRCCKGFGHLAQNFRNKGVEKRETIPQNKFEVLSSRIMQCEEGERTIKRVGVAEVECFKCGKKRHKCRECPLWVKKEKTAHVARPQKAQQKKRPACPVKEKAQEKERRLRRVEGSKAACPT